MSLLQTAMSYAAHIIHMPANFARIISGAKLTSVIYSSLTVSIWSNYPSVFSPTVLAFVPFLYISLGIWYTRRYS